MERTTVALIAPSMEILGGHAIHAQALAQGLQREGYGILFVPINPELSPQLRWLRSLPYVRTVVNETRYLPTLFRLRQADLVHVFSASYWSFVLAPLPAILLSRRFGKRVVLHYHSGEAPDHLARWGPLVHPWLRLVDEIVVPSEFLRAVFAEYGYRARVIRNIVDTARFTYRERQILRPRLLSTRNLERHYQVENTLRAFAHVQVLHPEATLTVAGSGSEESRLRQLADSLRVAGIRFVGRVEPEAMPHLCNDADIFLNSSVIDNQPVSVLEAYASGLPVVSIGTGDLATLVRDGETGLIVPPGNPHAMSDAIMRLLRNPHQAVAMTRRARQETERYTWAHVRQEWAAVYSGQGTWEGPGQRPSTSEAVCHT